MVSEVCFGFLYAPLVFFTVLPVSLQPDTYSLPPACPYAIKMLGSFFILRGFLTSLSWSGPNLSTIPSNIPYFNQKCILQLQ